MCSGRYRGTGEGDAAALLALWEQKILRRVGRRFVVLGIGNRARGDDGVGSIVAEQLGEQSLCTAFDCAGVPENYLGRVARLHPTDIIFVDAVDFGGAAGSIELIEGVGLPVQSPSSHSAGLGPLVDFFSRSLGASCWLLAVQPAQLACRRPACLSRHTVGMEASSGDGWRTLGQGLSQPVQEAVEAIVSSPVWAEMARQGQQRRAETPE